MQSLRQNAKSNGGNLAGTPENDDNDIAVMCRSTLPGAARVGGPRRPQSRIRRHGWLLTGAISSE